jgi:hypothetical protein
VTDLRRFGVIISLLGLFFGVGGALLTNAMVAGEYKNKILELEVDMKAVQVKVESLNADVVNMKIEESRNGVRWETVQKNMDDFKRTQGEVMKLLGRLLRDAETAHSKIQQY